MSKDRFADAASNDDLYAPKEDFQEYSGEVVGAKWVMRSFENQQPRLNLELTVMLDEPIGDKSEATCLIQADKSMLTDDGEWALDEETMTPVPFHKNTRMGMFVARAFGDERKTFNCNGKEYHNFGLGDFFRERGEVANYAPIWIGHKFHFLTDVIEYKFTEVEKDEEGNAVLDENGEEVKTERVIESRKVMPVEHLGHDGL